MVVVVPGFPLDEVVNEIMELEVNRYLWPERQSFCFLFFFFLPSAVVISFCSVGFVRLADALSPDRERNVAEL